MKVIGKGRERERGAEKEEREAGKEERRKHQD